MDPVRIVKWPVRGADGAGYSITMKAQSLADYEYPTGKEWRAVATPAGGASDARGRAR